MWSKTGGTLIKFLAFTVPLAAGVMRIRGLEITRIGNVYAVLALGYGGHFNVPLKKQKG